MHHIRSSLVAAAIVCLAGCAGPGRAVDDWHHLVDSSDHVALSALPIADSRAAYADLGAHEASPRRLGVMTFNVHHQKNRRHLEEMGEDLRARGTRAPDFILCQEVLFGRRGLHENTAQTMAAPLGYFTRGTRRDSDKQGVAIVSRFPFVHYEARQLRARTSSLLLGFRRVSVMGEFMVPGVGRVRVVNLHLANWGFEGHVRESQLRETLEWVARRQLVRPADVTILGGDFNAELGSNALDLLGQASVTGPLFYRDFNSERHSKSALVGGRRVDLLFVAAPEHRPTILSEEILWADGVPSKDHGRRSRPSDHVAIVHDYVFTERLR